MLCHATLGIALLAASAAADDQMHQPLASDRIQEMLAHELADHDIHGVTVAVEGEDVTLTGQVDSAWQKNKAQRLALETTDVVSVANRLDIARAESDRDIGETVAQKVRHYVFYTVYDHVELAVQDGRVALGGWVTQDYKADEIANLAAKTSGVQAVRNEIETLPLSNFDIELRRRIARQIYDDPLFWNAALGPDHPIHVVVRNGDVTLEGVVASEVHKQKAEIIARSAFGALQITNNLRVE